MKRMILIAVSLGLAAAVSLPAQQRPQERERQGKEEHGRAEYHFRQEDARRLREHYSNFNHVDVKHRHRLAAGERLTGDWHKRIRPVPEEVIRELPPPPPGYVFGYIDGYAVVYDPGTGMIADVIDLANLP